MNTSNIMLRLLTKCNQTLISKSQHHQLQSLYNIVLTTRNLSTSLRRSSISSNISTSISLIKQQKKTSTPTYLLVSWGFKPSTKSVSVVRFFKRFGFSDTQIKTVVTKTPRVLSSNPSKTIWPKIDFLRSIGLSEQDVIKMLVLYPYVLWSSLHKGLIPLFDMFKHFCGGQENAAGKIKKWPSFLLGTSKYLAPNVKTLRDLGVPETRVVKMVAELSNHGTTCATTKPSWYRKVVATVMDMGFDPSSSLFQHAVRVMSWQGELSWLKKINVFKKLGLSEGEIHDMFKKQPIALSLSEKNITAAANFYFEKCNWSPSHLSKYPNALLYSMDKRVIPRCSVLQVLTSRKKVKKINISTLLRKTDNEFMEQYINNYKGDVPELLDAYQGKIKFEKFNFLKN